MEVLDVVVEAAVVEVDEMTQVGWQLNVVLKSEEVEELDRLLQNEKKTLIFVRLKEIGQQIAKRYNIPFVFGETRDRLSIVRENQTVVISQVGDEGLSIPELERVIEVDWLFGSRREELQRMTRVLHGQIGEGEHNIIMTVSTSTNAVQSFIESINPLMVIIAVAVVAAAVVAIRKIRS